MARLFHDLHKDIFKVLYGRHQFFYAELLVEIHEEFFGDTSVVETPRQGEITRFIADISPRLKEKTGFEAISDDENEATSAVDYPSQVFALLRDTGWLEVYREHYVSYVEMPFMASMLLRGILGLSETARANYGRKVEKVLALLRMVKSDPGKHAASLISAEEEAVEFVNHLRAIISDLRRVEKAMTDDPDASAVLRNFFERFVDEILIEDYRALKGENNPFRFRFEILDEINHFGAEPQRIRRIAEAYVKDESQKELTTLELAEARVGKSLDRIRGIFWRVDALVERIDNTRSRLEQRVATTVRYLGYTESTPIGRLKSLSEKLAKSFRDADGDKDPLNAQYKLPNPEIIANILPIGPETLFEPRQARVQHKPALMEVPSFDPVQEAHDEAIEQFTAMLEVTSERIGSYLGRAFQHQTSLAACELPLETLEDFLVFDRLRDPEGLYEDGTFQPYIVEEMDNWFESDWIRCRNFTIRQKSPKAL